MANRQTAASPKLIAPQRKFAEANSTRAGMADWLREGILAGTFALGTSLPSERDLMARFEVSRATVREALRTLATQGLIEARRGRNGGSYVCGPSQSAVSSSLTLLIKGQDFRFIDLLAAREAIEPVAAAQAAEFRGDQDLARLHELTLACEASFSDIKEFVAVNLEWHLAIVQASHNSLFQAFMSSISSALSVATDLEEFDLKTRKAVVGLHWQIFAAIREGDRAAARRRMARHVGAYGEMLSTIDLADSGVDTTVGAIVSLAPEAT